MARIDFDIEKAKNGAKVVTTFGAEVRILCYDALGKYPIVALVKDSVRSIEEVYVYYENGKRFLGVDTKNDLFLEIPDRWVVIYTNEFGRDTMYHIIFDTKEEAEKLGESIYTETKVIKLIE